LPPGIVLSMLVQEQIDASGVDFRKEANQVLQAAAETVHRPCHNNIELTACCRFMQGTERWPLVLALGAADAVILVSVYDLPAGALGYLAQLALLVSRGLVDG
jgi:hypothetical protein